MARLWKRRGYGGAFLAAVLVLALVLRVKGIAWGLPYSFLNADESVVVPKGFAVAAGHVNPQFFLYPSFFFYLLGALYLLATPVMWLTTHANPLAAGAFVVDQGPYYLLGRLLSVALGTASVYLLYRIGSAAFGRPAGLLAALFLAVLPLHVAYSHMAVTDVSATALSLLALLLLLEAAQGRGRSWLVAGAVAAGLATSTKYNLGMLVLPATVAAAFACRADVARRVAAGARAARVWPRRLLADVYAPMLLAFLAGSPFVVIDGPHFVRDFLKQSRIMDRGWLGFEGIDSGFWYNLQVNLGSTLGVVLLVLAVAGLAWALWRRTVLDLMLAPYIVVYFAYISTWKELADRYLLPLLPLLVLLAVRVCLDVTQLRARWRRAVVPVVAVLMAVAFALPLSASVAFDRGLAGTDVRVRAKAWVERNAPTGSVIAAENYGPPLVSVQSAASFVGRGPAPQTYRLLRLSLPEPGVPNPSHSFEWLRDRHADYVIVSSQVYGRVLAASSIYPDVVAFYRRLDANADLVRVFAPGPGERGPVLKLYRLGTAGPRG